MRLLLQKAYLMITTRCNIHCRYCIVRKTNEDIDIAAIHKAIELVVDSVGDDKKIAIYGGEPLTRFDLVEEVVDSVARVRERTQKDLQTYLYTNGYLLDAAKIDYLRRNELKAVFSLDVCQELLPAEQQSENHRATFATRRENALRLIDTVGPENVCGASVILPDEVHLLERQFAYLTDELGFRVVKILPGLVRYHWAEPQVAALEAGLNRLFKTVLDHARRGRFVFLDSVNDALLRTNLRYDGAVQVAVIEVYPDGSFGISPCEFEGPDGLENVNEIRHFHLGSIEAVDLPAVAARLAAIDLPRHSGLLQLSQWSERVARWLTQVAPRDERIAHYVRQAKSLAFA